MSDPPGGTPPVSGKDLEHRFEEFLRARDASPELEFDHWVVQYSEFEPELRAEYDRKCQSDEDWGQRLRDQFLPEGRQDRALDELRERLSERGPQPGRYTERDEIGRGGQGVVIEVWDEDLERSLAKKVLRAPSVSSFTKASSFAKGPTAAEGRLRRFLHEAKITGQLDHQAIVPVHELAVDDDNRICFYMKLVSGENFGEKLERVEAGDPDWSQTRALGVLLRVCEAIAFAHDRGVIHRDLKPKNIMVGENGVYVMDWGFGGTVDKEGRRELGGDEPPSRSNRAARPATGAAEGPRASALETMEGDVFGTPVYMSPEQAGGRISEVGTASDVYSLGAILYQILCGRLPYMDPGRAVDDRAILAAVLKGPPVPVEQIRQGIPLELVAICERAMLRNPQDRYSTVYELAQDLQAYLEGRVVQAHRTGALIELRKWAQRNRGLAAALVVGAVLLAGLGVATAAAVISERKADQLDTANRSLEASNSQLDVSNAALGVANRLLDEANGTLLTRNQELGSANDALATSNAKLDRSNQVLGDIEVLRDLREREARLWPARPAKLEEMDHWLTEAEDLLGRIPGHEAELGELLAQAAPVDEKRIEAALRTSPRFREYEDFRILIGMEDEKLRSLQDAEFEPEKVPGRRAQLEESRAAFVVARAAIEQEVRESLSGRFPGRPELQWRFDNLTLLSKGARALSAPQTGLLSSMEQRRERAATIWDETIGEVLDEWQEATDAIAKSEHYAGLELSEQVGLIPIGADPESALWEFWHVESGARPERDPESGAIVVSEEMGIVLVLIPGGTFWMGASRDSSSENHDPDAATDEVPVHQVTLRPFFLSKYEMTQGQWHLLSGERPSQYPAGEAIGDIAILASNPVTNVSWDDCTSILPHYGLCLPTEAQWEYGARAGSSSPYWCGGAESIPGVQRAAGNVFDEWTLKRNPETASWGASDPWDDGHSIHAPVGLYRANHFGLYDVLGNVWEWCEDLYEVGGYRRPLIDEDGRRLVGHRSEGLGDRANRGGSFMSSAVNSRAATRGPTWSSSSGINLGVRAAKRILDD